MYHNDYVSSLFILNCTNLSYSRMVHVSMRMCKHKCHVKVKLEDYNQNVPKTVKLKAEY
jgi:hypothetical protein